jgi:sugar lactone lactonase YvrE
MSSADDRLDRRITEILGGLETVDLRRAPGVTAPPRRRLRIALAAAGCIALLLAGVGVVALRRAANPTPSPTPAGSTATTDRGGGALPQFSPNVLVFDPAGRLVVTDCDEARVFRIDRSGRPVVIAGSGPTGFSAGFGGDGGPATAAEMKCPTGVALDPAGGLLVADYGNDRIRRIAPDGTIASIAGGAPDDGNERVGDGGPATRASLFGPTLLAVGPDDAVYVADRDHNRIRRIAPDGTITTFAGGHDQGFAGDGGPATAAALDNPAGMAFDAAGDLYFADSNNNRVRKIDRQGVITTVAGTGEAVTTGTGGPASQAGLADPESVAFDAAGNLYIGEANGNRVRRVRPDGVIEPFAGDGRVGVAPDGTPAASAPLRVAGSPVALAIDARGTVYLVEQGNHCIRTIDGSGKLGTIGPACAPPPAG